MLLYIFIAALFLLKKKNTNKDKYILMSLGLTLISISFFNNYNFSDFSRMQFFVSLVSSLLIYAISLQKLEGKINVYLKVSPAMLMILSFFFYNSITMLLYTIATFFIFTLLYIWSRMDAPLLDVLKLTSRLFILSLPVVVILFMVFPRISFKKADFGFREDGYSLVGYDGVMNVSSKGVRLSEKVVMEVFFEDDDISDDDLYFRGSTLYKQEGAQWNRLQNMPKDKLSDIGEIKKYDVTIYPHAEKWMYALDLPIAPPKNAELRGDYTLESKKVIYQKKKYTLSSALFYTLRSSTLGDALQFDAQKNEQLYNALEEIRTQELSKKEKASLLIDFFKAQRLQYSLQPMDIDEEDPNDSFLFEAKRGYCVHFASAFAISARMLGIASRVVTGYKADMKNMLNNYLVVKEKDAHAWVELYFEKEGWLRFDPTATATKIELKVQEQMRSETSIFKEINLKFMYAKYLVDRWVLGYNRLKQMDILKSLLNDTIYLLKFSASILTLFIVVFLIYINIKNNRCADEFMCEIYKLMDILRRYSLLKKESETMEAFLKRAEKKMGVSLEKINSIYHREKYGKRDENDNTDMLKEEINTLREMLKKSTLSSDGK
jgi:hypothetical protein